MSGSTPRPSKAKQSVTTHLLSGGLSGLASCLLLQPLDRILLLCPFLKLRLNHILKTRLQQTERIKDGVVRGRIWNTAATIVRTEGVAGLWRGTAPTVARNVPGVALYFTTLTYLRRYVSRPDSLVAHLASTAKASVPGTAWPRLSAAGDVATGSSARVAVGFVLMPVTVIKARAESSLYPKASITAHTRLLMQEGGIRALWQGFIPTALRDGPYAGIFILSYERAKVALNAAQLGLPSSIRDSAAGAIGAVFATLLTAPFDTIKTQRQLRPAEYTSLIRSVSLIAARKGFVGFFEGAALRISRKAGSSAIAYSLYEGLISRFAPS